VQGIAGSALNPLIDSLALALARAERMAYGPVRSIGSIAYMAASAGAGWLLSVAGSWLVPWLLAGCYAAVAAFIASGMADAGLGVETAARQFHLGFVPLMMERYFLLVRRESLETPMIERLLAVMRSREFKAHLVGLQGLDSGRCGKVEELWQALPSLAPAGAKRRKAATAG